METDMTETEWLECDRPAPMIEFLRNTHLNDRKLFLVGCAWARRFWDRLGRRSQNAIEVYERLADGKAPLGDYDAAWSRFKEESDKHGDYFAFNEVDESEMDFYTALIQARAAWRRALPYVEEDPTAEAGLALPARGVYSVGRGALIDASDEFYMASDGQESEYKAQCDIIRDIFGNPFRTITLDEAWMSEFGEVTGVFAWGLNYGRYFKYMTKFADFLGADFPNQEVLSHCRSQSQHVRGCWVIDLLSGSDKIEFPLGARMPLLIPADLNETESEFQANYEKAARDNRKIGEMLRQTMEKHSMSGDDGANISDTDAE